MIVTTPIDAVNHSALVALGFLAIVILFSIWFYVKKGDEHE